MQILVLLIFTIWACFGCVSMGYRMPKPPEEPKTIEIGIELNQSNQEFLESKNVPIDFTVVDSINANPFFSTLKVFGIRNCQNCEKQVVLKISNKGEQEGTLGRRIWKIVSGITLTLIPYFEKRKIELEIVDKKSGKIISQQSFEYELSRSFLNIITDFENRGSYYSIFSERDLFLNKAAEISSRVLKENY